MDQHGVCLGCGRTLEQIAAWGGMAEAERLRIMTTLAADTHAIGDSQAPCPPVADGPRIVSLLPAATEIAFALGLGQAVVGVSHECRFPPAARSRPAVVRSAVALDGLTPLQIDAAVSQRLAQRESLYVIDELLLQELRPDLVLTQDLCQVCAPSGNQLAHALAALRPRPTVLAMTPHALADILTNIQELGQLTSHVAEANALIASCRKRLASVRAVVPPGSARRRVFFVEWIDPIYCSGHWVPDMIELAGGVDELARPGQDSIRVAWADVTRWAPEFLIVAPCGCNTGQALEQLPALAALPGWSALPAVQRGQVYCVDANAYFACPGPRIFEGIELLAHLMDRERIRWTGPDDAYCTVQSLTID